MAEHTTEKKASPLNLNSLLAVLTLTGSVWLVSHKLSSDRPVTPAGGADVFPGEQTLEARLWEDPFKTSEEARKAGDLSSLVGQIRERSNTTNILFLPVMLSGGHFGEDQESRIRGRLAIISALNQSGYAPEDAEHLGVVNISWPSRHQLDRVKRESRRDLTYTSLQSAISNTCMVSTNATLEQVGSETNSPIMALHFEWFQVRTFFDDVLQTNCPTVLVLWLDDSFFEDEPLLRLPLLFEPLLAAHHSTGARVSLIGPHRSSSLRATLRPLSDNEPSPAIPGTLWNLAVNILNKIDVFCATPSAIDTMLLGVEGNAVVPGNSAEEKDPRWRVRRRMLANGFRSFTNFAATDEQLAEEIFDELKLRRADLTKPENHLVLISESDTFYGRAVSLTYRAHLARLKYNQSNAWFFAQARYGQATQFENFHSFAYLRGLDGQTVTSNERRKEERDSKTHAVVDSFEELRKWLPDANKAEGQAQFDYLARLGDSLNALRKEIRRSHRGRIAAIGIIGSDVYDTLLILQALRDRFPETLFFTTDMDARFCHPRERDWTRNLLIVSSYGLALSRHIQKEVPPFRDSLQTAEFAAALAILDNSDALAIADANISPRRFEIGNRAAVDLSTTDALAHPPTFRNPLGYNPRSRLECLFLSLFILVLCLIPLCCYWPPLACLTFKSSAYTAFSLKYPIDGEDSPPAATIIRPDPARAPAPAAEQRPPPAASLSANKGSEKTGI